MTCSSYIIYMYKKKIKYVETKKKKIPFRKLPDSLILVPTSSRDWNLLGSSINFVYVSGSSFPKIFGILELVNTGFEKKLPVIFILLNVSLVDD